MSLVSIGLNLILAGLLLAAVFVGVRLNARLKALKTGQADFVKAVQELDAAAARAEAGLTALRAAQDQTHDSLLARIETARGLVSRLEAAGQRAAPLADAEPPIRPAAPYLGPAGQPRAPRATGPRPAAREIDDDLFEDLRRPEPPARRSFGR